MAPLILLISPSRLQVINLSCGLLIRLLDLSPGLRSEVLGKSSLYHVKKVLACFKESDPPCVMILQGYNFGILAYFIWYLCFYQRPFWTWSPLSLTGWGELWL